MLTLIHNPKSRSSRLIWLLEELGLPFDIRYVSIPRMDGTGAPDPNNPHPDKKVPALLDGDKLITESAAICLYLTDMAPEAGIAPKPGDPLRGEYLSWLFYYAGVVEPVMTAQYGGFGDNPAFIRTFRGRAEMDARMIKALEHHAFLLGPNFTGVDILFSSMGMWAREMLPAGALVDSYIAACMARPALTRSYHKDAGPN